MFLFLASIQAHGTPETPDGLAAHWTFDNDADSRIGEWTGTVEGDGQIAAPGAILGSGCYRLEPGKSGYIQTDFLPPSRFNPRSFSLWFKTDPESKSTMSLFGWGSEFWDSRYDLVIHPNKLQLEFDSSNFISRKFFLPGTSFGPYINPEDTRWHHVLVTYDGGEASTNSIFLDGHPPPYFVINDKYFATVAQTALRIGTGMKRKASAYYGTIRDFQGNIDDLAVFDKALDGTDAILIHAMGRFGLPLESWANARALWEMPMGATKKIAGLVWKKTGKLPGNRIDYGGSVEGLDAYVVLDRHHSGIRIQPPASARPEDLADNAPDDLRFGIGYGRQTSFDIHLTNRNATLPAGWMVGCSDESGDQLARVLELIDSRQNSLLGVIPARFLFEGGTSGNHIENGGQSMYATGNSLSFDGATLPYSEHAISSFSSGSGAARYFTRKLPGLFILGAELHGINTFAVNGQSGHPKNEADFPGRSATREFTIFSNGLRWRAFAQQIYGMKGPGICHIILVPDTAGIQRSTDADESTENHVVSGLANTKRLYYLLFSRPDGARINTTAFLDLARAFLSCIDETPPWFRPEAFRGRLDPDASGSVSVRIDATPLAPGTYSTRFAVVSTASESGEIPENRWHTLDLTVNQPTFSLDRELIEIDGISGIDPVPKKIRIRPADPATNLATISVASDKPWLSTKPVDGQADRIALLFATSTLPPGTHTATVSVWNNETKRTIPVSVHITRPNIAKLLADPARPRLYAVNQNETRPGSILVIDTRTRRLVKSIPVGREPTDIDFTENAGGLLVMNSSDPSIMLIDLESLEITESWQLETFGTGTQHPGARIADGPGSIIYYVDRQWDPCLRVFDASTGTVVQSFIDENASLDTAATIPYSCAGFRDIAANPDKTSLFGWTRRSATDSCLVRFDIDPEGHLHYAEAKHLKHPFSSRASPYDTPILITPDGDRLIANRLVADPFSLDECSSVFETPIYALGPAGEIACGANAIYPGSGGKALHRFETGMTAQTITPDCAWHVGFDTQTKTLRWLDLPATLGPEALGFAISPPDGATGHHFARLRWIPSPGARRYRIYLGLDRASVEAANPASPEFLGETTGFFFDLPPSMELGATYFWKAVPVDPDENPVSGALHFFHTAPLSLSPPAIATTAVAHGPAFSEPVRLAANGPIPWSASTEADWISLIHPSGAAPSNIEVRLDPSGLEPGLHQSSIVFVSGASTWKLPVSLEIQPLDVIGMKPDPADPGLIYALNRSPKRSVPCRLLRIDASSGDIAATLEAGSDAADFDIDPATRLLYVASSRHPEIQIIDLATFSKRPPIELEVNVHRIELDGRNHIIYYGESGNAWRLRARRLDTLEPVSVSPHYEVADMETAPATRTLYSIATVLNQDITQFAIEPDAIQAMNRNAIPSYFPGERLLVSNDGQRIIAGASVFDADLHPLAPLPDNALAISPDGELAADAGAIRWTDGGAQAAPLPAKAMCAAFACDGSRLVFLAESGKPFQSADIGSLVPLPGPSPRSGQIFRHSPESFSWTPVPDATSYRLVIEAASGRTRTFSGIPKPSFRLPDPLPFGTNYSWHTVAETPDGPVVSPSRAFSVLFPELPPVRPDPSYDVFSLCFAGNQFIAGYSRMYAGSSACVYDFDPATGSCHSRQAFSLEPFSFEQRFGESVGIDAEGTVFIGNPPPNHYAGDPGFPPDPGEFREFRMDFRGTYQAAATFPPPVDEPEAGFARQIAVSGTTMLVSGTNLEGGTAPGWVSVYLTQPTTTLVQTLRPDDSAPNNQFGASIAISGNTALVGAPGLARPAAYIFARNPQTGLWRQQQKLELPPANPGEKPRLAAAIGADIIAVGNQRGTIFVFSRNGPGQDWTLNDTIRIASEATNNPPSIASLAISEDGGIFTGCPTALHYGLASGKVFFFRRQGNSWKEGPSIIPSDLYYLYHFGGSIAIRGSWLLASSAEQIHRFQIGERRNQAPRFTSLLPVHAAVDGTEFRLPVTATDPDGGEGLHIELAGAPPWMRLDDLGSGNATLRGTPEGNPGDRVFVQLRATDPAGASAMRSFSLVLSEHPDSLTITGQSADRSVGVGQTLVLRGSAQSTAPVRWQWQKNGIDLPGAIHPILEIAKVTPGDAGVYSFVVRNATTRRSSRPVKVTVHPANRFAGPWPSPGGNPQHNGAHPATLGTHLFVESWTAALPTLSASTESAAAPVLADGMVFSSTPQNGAQSPAVFALSLQTGKQIWRRRFGPPAFPGPPSWHNHRLYLGCGTETNDGEMICLDARTGAVVWRSAYDSTNQSLHPPILTEYGLWTNGGESGGICKYTMDGQLAFLRHFYSGDIPPFSLSNNHLYLCWNGQFRACNPRDGKPVWWISDPEFVPSTPVLATNRCIVSGNRHLICIDLDKQRILWKTSGDFAPNPSANAHSVFAVENSVVRSFSLATGKPGPVFDPGIPEPLTPRQQPIILNDYLIVSSTSRTFIFDIASTELVQSLEGGGNLAYSGGYLAAAAPDETLRAWFAAHPPALDASAAPALNRQTGLYEQSLTITNHEPVAIPGFDLRITGLPDDVRVWNASDRTDGGATVEFHQPLAAGASATLVLEYYVKQRGTEIHPDISVSLAAESRPHPPAPDGGLPIDRALRLADGAMLVEFTATPGALYEVHYSPDGEHWKLSPVRIRAAGNRVQWIDRGPPRTDVPPSEAPVRFYRVKEISKNN